MAFTKITGLSLGIFVSFPTGRILWKKQASLIKLPEITRLQNYRAHWNWEVYSLA